MLWTLFVEAGFPTKHGVSGVSSVSRPASFRDLPAFDTTITRFQIPTYALGFNWEPSFNLTPVFLCPSTLVAEPSLQFLFPLSMTTYFFLLDMQWKRKEGINFMNWKFELHGDRKTRAKASFWVRSGSTVVRYNFRYLLVIISSCLSINSHCQDGRRNPKLTLRVVEGVLEQVKGRSASVASYKRPTDFPGFHDYWGKGKRSGRQANLLYGVLSLRKF